MGVINRLDRHVAELIAAGEVVERPASVVKEVVENALDAGASAVTVEIKNGGMTFIRVTDNGSGMYRDDVPLAFLSHATSKIRNADDLEAILTMGFRGEALASIAAVARVELLTRREEELEGTRYQICGACEEENAPAGCPKGTTILIRDLFYNTPARLKFVKKDVSEANAVAGVLDKLAVAYPEVSFKFIRDGELKLNTPGDGKLLSAVYAVFGRDFSKGLCEVHYANGGLRLEGLISRPEASRPNRSMQNFFINQRFVRSRTCGAALEEACKGAIMVGKFPACVLNLTIEPDTVDVNVHPAKIEVRFSNEKSIFDLVYFGVKNALTALNAPEITMASPKRTLPAFPETSGTEQLRIPAEEYRKLAGLPPRALENDEDKTPKNGAKRPASPLFGAILERPAQIGALRDDNSVFGGYETRKTALEQAKSEVKSSIALQESSRENNPEIQSFHVQQEEPRPADSFEIASDVISADALESVKEERTVSQYDGARLVGELFSTYIVLENADKMILIDKHAAHERILFEQMKEVRGDEWRQTLLAPVTVTLDRVEYAAALEHVEVLAACGFEAEDFGGGSLLVRTAPMWVAVGEASSIVSELCANLAEHRHDVSPDFLDNLYHSVACRAAVKGGNKNGLPELKEIVRMLEADGEIKHCPHGRPVAVVMTRHELEKQFGRV